MPAQWGLEAVVEQRLHAHAGCSNIEFQQLLRPGLMTVVDSKPTEVWMTAVQVKYVGGCGKRECGSQMLKPHGTHGCCNASVTMKLQTTIKHYGWEIVT